MISPRSTLYIQIAIFLAFVAIVAYAITTRPLTIKEKATEEIQKSTYTDALYGFSIEYPSTWSVYQETTGNLYSVFFIAPFPLISSLNGSVVVNVSPDFFNGDIDAFASAYVARAKYEYESLNNKNTLLVHEKTTFLDFPAYRHVTTKTRFLDEQKPKSITQKTEGFAFIHNSKVYLIEYKNDLIKFELMKSIGDDIIGSFKF